MTMHDRVYRTLPEKATQYHQTVALASVI
ncbi:hypothetical protein LINGRAHAP2_LOCUS21809 [Linum grandiflorum]